MDKPKKQQENYSALNDRYNDAIDEYEKFLPDFDEIMKIISENNQSIAATTIAIAKRLGVEK